MGTFLMSFQGDTIKEFQHRWNARLECQVGLEVRCAPRETAPGLQAAEVEGRLFALAT